MAIDTSSLGSAKKKPAKPSAGKKLLEMEITIGSFGKPGLPERMMLTERLALMTDTGSPLHSSLLTLAKTAGDPQVKRIITDIADGIDKGGSFAVSLSRHREFFDATYINLVAAGEKGGFLPEVLRQLHETDRKRVELNNAVRGALFYPAFLLLFSVAVVVFVMLVLYPKFAPLFSSIHDRLPVTTKVLMSMSDFMINHWVWLLSGLGLIIATIIFLFTRPAVQLWFDGWKLRAPLVREIIVRYYFLQTLRVLSLSLQNGVNVLDALKGCREVISNSVFRAFLDDTSRRVELGEGIGAGFRATKMVPDLVKEMIVTGDETANLAKVMSRIALHYEEELDNNIKMVAKLAEPIMLLVMGGFVGLLVSSLILPIFQLSRAIH